MKNVKQFSPEPDAGNSGGTADVVAPIVEPTTEQVAATQAIETTKQQGPIDIESATKLFQDENILGEEKPAELVKTAEQIASDATKVADAAKSAAEKEPTEFTLKVDAKEGEKTEITSWKDLGTVLDFEVKDDSEEGVKSAYQTHLTAKINEAVEAAKNVTLESELKNIDPEAQNLFDYLKVGGKAQDWVNQLKPFEKMEAMPNDELVREAEKLEETPEAEIDKKIVDLTDNGTLDAEAKTIRDFVTAEKQKYQQKIVQKKQETFNKIYKAENEAIKSALDKVETIMDIPLKKEIRDGLAAKIPVYRERFKNEPALVAELIALHELKDQAKGFIYKKGWDEATSKLKGKIFNLEEVPTKNGGSASRTDNGGGLTLAEQFEAKLKEERAAQ